MISFYILCVGLLFAGTSVIFANDRWAGFLSLMFTLIVLMAWLKSIDGEISLTSAIVLTGCSFIVWVSNGERR